MKKRNKFYICLAILVFIGLIWADAVGGSDKTEKKRKGRGQLTRETIPIRAIRIGIVFLKMFLKS